MSSDGARTAERRVGRRYTTDGAGIPAWGFPEGVDTSKIRGVNFGDLAPNQDNRNYGNRVIDAVLEQSGRAECDWPNGEVPADAASDNFCYGPPGAGGVQAMRDDRPDCCLARKLEVPGVESGLFSVLKKSSESISDAVCGPRGNRSNFHVAAASTEYPRRGRGVAATRLRGIFTARRPVSAEYSRRGDPSPRNIHIVATRLRGISTARRPAEYPRRRDQSPRCGVGVGATLRRRWRSGTRAATTPSASTAATRTS